MIQRHALLSLALAAGPLYAQAPTIAPAPSVLFRTAEPRAAAEQEVVGGDSGAAATATQNGISLLGGGVGAVGGYILAASLRGMGGCADLPGASCENEAPLGWRIGGAVVGGAAGYLVGRGLSGRWSKRAAPGEVSVELPHEDKGMRWWEGAALGGLVGGVGVPVLVNTFRLNEGGDGVPAIAFAPVGALLGLVVGGSLAQSK